MLKYFIQFFIGTALNEKTVWAKNREDAIKTVKAKKPTANITCVYQF